MKLYNMSAIARFCTRAVETGSIPKLDCRIRYTAQNTTMFPVSPAEGGTVNRREMQRSCSNSDVLTVIENKW